MRHNRLHRIVIASLAVLSTIAVTVATFHPAAAAQTAKKSTTASKTAKKAAPAQPEVPLPAEPGLYAVFNTSMGPIVTRLFEDKAPITVKNFVALAKGLKASASPKTGALVHRPLYNGLTFHRVIKGFMIQFGDVAGTGAGDCKVPTIPDEFDPSLKFDAPGKLAMANIGKPHTGSCQAFITVGKAEHLNGLHTIFGEVVSGQDIADQISEVSVGANDKPVTPVVVKSVLIRRKQ